LLVAEAGGAVCPFMEIGSLLDGGPVLASTPAIAGGVSVASGIPVQKREQAARLQLA
jgi:myo-inositol-1(or 4)-monophosphatase